MSVAMRTVKPAKPRLRAGVDGLRHVDEPSPEPTPQTGQVADAIVAYGHSGAKVFIHDAAAGNPYRCQLTKAIANMIGFAVAVPWDVIAVATSYTIRGYLLWPESWWMLHRPFLLSLLRYTQALATAAAGAAVMAGILLLSQIRLPTAAGVFSILVVSALAGAISYAVVVCTAAPEQQQAFWRLLAQRMPAHGARS